MTDQAAGLRRVAGTTEGLPATESSAARVHVVGSGKGGVGKSAIAVLLASALARAGRKVLLLDACQNLGNLHILLGAKPTWDLGAVLTGNAQPSDLLVPVAERLVLLPVSSGEEALYTLTATDRARLHLRLTNLYEDFDEVVVDAGPGIEATIRATMRATRLIVVAVPEPASLSDAYALIKTATLHAPGLPIDVLANRVMTETEGRNTFDVLALAARSFLRREIGRLGDVGEHESLRRAVRVPGGLLSETLPEITMITETIVTDPTACVLAGGPEGRA
jgi:flagellar biosynthesis protein FlhG